MIARSNTIDEDGNVVPQTGSQNVNHQTPHPDRWGGWFVTSEDAAPPYAQMAHRGNITFSGRGNTSNQVFVDWLNSSPETLGYVSSSSDIVGLLALRSSDARDQPADEAELGVARRGGRR